VTTPSKHPPAQPRPLRFSGHTVRGDSRGKSLGYPTINVDLQDVPHDLEHGIYACWSEVDGKRYRAAVHYGPRPVFSAGIAFEVHLLDSVLESLPATITVDVVQRLRDVKNFDDAESLKTAIADDVTRTRAILENA
jgi:riboflavin kinase / FMN adenylyltransferase